MTGALLEVRDLGKRYRAYGSGLAQLGSWLGLPLRPQREFWALQAFSATLRSGEALGVIGQNGAGKSTLLKLIAGTIQPSTGHVWRCQNVGVILELGLGFHPDLTGRQNIYHGAGLRGLTQEQIDVLMPEIEAFAELGGYFDEPLRTYSSGMQARLAFALVSANRPDLLMIDEILSVGDAYFQHKSFERIRQFKQAGSGILLVSHNMADIRALCDRAILLDRGCMLREGPVDEIVDLYNARLAEKEAGTLTVEQRRRKNGWVLTRSGTYDATVISAELQDAISRTPIGVARVGQPIVFRMVVSIRRPVSQLVLGCMIRDRTGHVVWGTNTWHTGQLVSGLEPGEEIEFLLQAPCSLGPGCYSLTHALTFGPHHALGNYEWTDNNLVFDVVNDDRAFFIGTSNLDAQFMIKRPVCTPATAST
jgi:lipopolysaccharide transport system ATP-binding protein